MIERMRKLLFMGPSSVKEEFLSRLQEAGLVQIEPYRGDSLPIDGRHALPQPAEQALSSYRTLLKYEKQAQRERIFLSSFPLQEPVERIVEELPLLEDKVRSLREKLQQLRNKRDSLLPWGDFDLSTIQALKERGHLTIQFWEVSHEYADTIDIPPVLGAMEVAADPERRYFITFSEEPIHVPDCLEIRMDEDLRTLDARIAVLESDLAATKERIYRMAAAKDAVFRHYLAELTKFDFAVAAWGSVKLFDGTIFVLQAWCPVSSEKDLRAIVRESPIHVEEIEPDPGERVPTLLVNHGVAALGENLVRIYDTPSYQDWDPSSWVFFSFMLFYSMIFGDAGYALTLIAILLYFRHKVKNPAPSLRRFFSLSLALCSAATVYGLAAGGFYGLAADNPLFGWVVRLAMLDTDIRHPGVLDTMMTISIVIGLIHITISLILKGARLFFSLGRRLAAIPVWAWVPGIWSFYVWARLNETDPPTAAFAIKVFWVSLLVVFFTNAGTWRPLKFFLGGFLGVYNGVQFFADVLSYLRLFALGLSGSLIAQNFNMITTMVWDAGPWYYTLVPAVIVFVFGHTLNIALCTMGGVIHGLRLNFLEWYRWCFDGGGRPFKAFRNLLHDASPR